MDSPSKVLSQERLDEIEADLHAGRIPGNWRALLDSHRALAILVKNRDAVIDDFVIRRTSPTEAGK
jgi:hypothetical protein